MGSSWSGEASQAGHDADVKRTLDLCLSPFERMSLAKHASAIGDNWDTQLAVELGIHNAPGRAMVMRMASTFAHSDLKNQLGLALCWLNGRLAAELGISELEWRQRLFEAAAIAEVGNEPYVPFQDLLDFVTLLLSAFDWDPQDQRRTEIDVLDVGLAARLLNRIKAPAIRYAQFSSVLDELPFLLVPLANIWDRLLYDSESTNTPAPLRLDVSLQRSDKALLFALQGPSVFRSLQLFQGTTKGFSMRAFEVGVTKWPVSSILVVTGHQPRSYTKWNSKARDVDKIVPRFYDTPIREAKNVVFALVVDEPWRASAKHCFGRRPLLLQLEPDFCVWELPPTTVFMSPAIGLGAGLPKPPTIDERHKGTVLFIDSSMEHGVLRSVPDHSPDGARFEYRFEYRFYVDQVEVLGCGSKQDLEKQQRAWAWEDSEANRRRTVNVQEDRALLELAGLVGQYAR